MVFIIYLTNFHKLKKSLFFIAFIIIAITSFAQVFPVISGSGNTSTLLNPHGAVKGDVGLINGVYFDTTAANANSYFKNYPGAQIYTTFDGSTWIRNGGAKKWIRINTFCQGLQPNTGIVSWTGSGLTFSATTAIFCINGNSYTALGANTTLATADPSLGRFDVIYADTLGFIGNITGVASATPAVPQVNTSKQIYLTNVYVGPGATTPGQISMTTVYDENTEWTSHGFGSITQDFNNTASPFHLVKASLTTNINLATDAPAGIFFTNSTPVSSSSYSTLNLHVKLNVGASFTAGQYISVSLTDGTLHDNTIPLNLSYYGLNGLITGVYQNISIPINNFAFYSGTSFQGVKLTFTGPNTAGFYIDYINLQSGIPSGSGNYVTNVFRVPGTDSVFQTINGINQFAFIDSTGGGGSATTLQQAFDNAPTATPQINAHGNNITVDSTNSFYVNVYGTTQTSGIVGDPDDFQIFSNDNSNHTSVVEVLPLRAHIVSSDASNHSDVYIMPKKVQIATDTLQLVTGFPGVGKVLTSDASGNATWQASGGGSTTLQQAINNSSDLSTQDNSVNVGDGAHYFDIVNDINDEQLYIQPGKIYSFGDPANDYGMGNISIVKSVGSKYFSIQSPDYVDINTAIPDTSGILFLTDSLGTDPVGILGYGLNGAVHKYAVPGGGSGIFIPLAGTDIGNPETGDIEFNGALVNYDPDDSITNNFKFRSGVQITSTNDTTGTQGNFNLSPSGLDVGISDGLTGSTTSVLIRQSYCVFQNNDNSFNFGINNPTPVYPLDVTGTANVTKQIIAKATVFGYNKVDVDYLADPLTDHVISVDNVLSTVTITLPDATNNTGLEITVKRYDATSVGTVTITAVSGDVQDETTGTFNTTTSLTLWGNQGQAVMFKSNGSAWEAIN